MQRLILIYHILPYKQQKMQRFKICVSHREKQQQQNLCHFALLTSIPADFTHM